MNYENRRANRDQNLYYFLCEYYLASVDLLLITQDDFNKILRSNLTKKWDVLRDALVHFNYFKLWDEETIRECCILSKLKDFKPNEVNNLAVQ